MPKFYSLEQPRPEEVKKLIKEIREGPEIDPRLTFNFPLNENRRAALEMIQSEEINQESQESQEKVIGLLESGDFVERQAGVYLLNKTSELSAEISEKALPILEEMSQDKDWGVRKAVAQALAHLGTKALPILEKMSRDKDWSVGKAVTQARVKIILETQGEKALPIFGKMSQSEEFWIVREAVVQARVKIIVKTQGENALPILEEMSQDENEVVRETVARALAHLGEKALPILEKISQDKNPDVREAAARALAHLGEKALPILERMHQDGNQFVKEVVTWSINKLRGVNFHSWLFATKKPLFSVPETRELIEKIAKLEEIAKELTKKFRDDFIGIVIFGSTAKGYSKKGSDLDWGIIAKKEEISKYFRELAGSLRLCIEHHVGVDKNYQVVSSPDVLFCGLFFGDHQQLRKLQKATLESISKDEWDKIREIIRDTETDLSKVAGRYGLTDEEMTKTKQFASLLRVPPSYQETLRIVRSRI